MMKAFTGITQNVLVGFFASHIIFTICLDCQGRVNTRADTYHAPPVTQTAPLLSLALSDSL